MITEAPLGARGAIRDVFERPGNFLREELKISLWSKQAEILSALRENRRVAVRSCNGSGKTFAAACAVVWWLMSFQDSAIAITTAPTERQVKELLWREIRGIHAKHKDRIGGEATHVGLEISATKYARGFSTDQPERFQGFHNENILFVVDEASGVQEEIFEAIEGSMTTPGARLLLIGNPTNRSGTFFDAFHSRRSMWRTIQISAFDTPNLRAMKGQSVVGRLLGRLGRRGDGVDGVDGLVTTDEVGIGRKRDSDFRQNDKTSVPGLVTAEWVEEAEKNWGKRSPLYQVRVLGEFPSQGRNTLIPLEHIERCVVRV